MRPLGQHRFDLDKDRHQIGLRETGRSLCLSRRCRYREQHGEQGQSDDKPSPPQRPALSPLRLHASQSSVQTGTEGSTDDTDQERLAK
ncbi:hypothetical protein MACH15_05720 [Maricaulis maris]|nr:hypothetical protein MACH15_05720 [Maricaulis maris]